MRRSRLVVALSALSLVATFVTFVVGAQAVPPQSGVIDLLTDGKQRIDGAVHAGNAGKSVAVAGDVNGDGHLDVIVGANRVNKNGIDLTGSAYVVFGPLPSTPVDLAALGSRGFQLDGSAAFDQAGWSVSSAGDTNGDGKSDVIVAVPWADNNGRTDSGTAYVVYGTTSTSTMELTALGDRGFRIDGEADGDTAGWSVSQAGDVNGDGRGDLVVGAPTADHGGSNSGSAYVIFGTASPANLDLVDLDDRGFRIDGALPVARAGDSVSRVSDMNGDGLDDLIVGAGSTDSQRGAAFVVFGKATTDPVNLATLGMGGFRIDGATADTVTGRVVSGAGDVNGDQRPDVIVGAEDSSNNGRSRSGSAYVVFGKTSNQPVDLAALGNAGFRIDGAVAEDSAGMAVAGAADVNGDRLADVLVGAPEAGNNGRDTSGSAYVVFGRPSTTTIDLAQLGSGGYRLDAPLRTDWLGEAVASGGDVTGDGVPDLLIGSPRGFPQGRGDEGAVHVFSFGPPRLAYGAPAVGTVGQALTQQAPSQLERTGPATFQVSPALPAGLTIDAAGRVNGTPTATHAQTTHTVTMEDLVGTVSAGLTITVVAAPAPPDTAAPRLTLRATSPQRALRQKKILVRASCNEACSLSALGTITILGRRPARVALRSAIAPRLTAGQRTLSLVLTRAQLKRLSGFLAKGRRARANVTVRARDAAGNRRTATRAIAVRR